MKKIKYTLIITLLFFSCNLNNKEEPTYSITYYGNGNTHGTIPVDLKQYHENNEAIILNNGNLKKTDHIFSHWNTEPDGTGTSFYSYASTHISKSLQLFAIWHELTEGVVFETFDIVDYTGTSTKVLISPNIIISTIESMAFNNSSLISFEAGGIFIIDPYAFMECTELKRVEIGFDYHFSPNIWKDSFYKCKSLKTIEFTNASIGENAFEGFNSLNTITFKGSNSVLWDNSFKNCKNLTDVTIQSDHLYLMENVFSGCEKLSSITLPKGISFKINSFSNSYIEEITLTSYPVSSIGKGVIDIAKIEKIVVPKNLLEEYKRHDQWVQFSDIIVAGDHEFVE